MQELIYPVIFPLIIYIYLVFNGLNSVQSMFIQALLQGNLILPYSWFVIVIAIFYLTYYLIGKYARNTNQFHCIYFILLIIVSIIMNQIGWSSSHYVSNIAFLLGFLYKSKEDVTLKLVSKIPGMRILCLFTMGAISMSYINNRTLFSGFALVAIPLWVLLFIISYGSVKINVLNSIKNIRKYSYDIYLCQGVAFYILSQFDLNCYAYVPLVLFVSTFIAIISYHIRMYFLDFYRSNYSL